MTSLINTNGPGPRVAGILLVFLVWTSLPSSSWAEPYNFPRVREYLDNQYYGFIPPRFHRGALPMYWNRAPVLRRQAFPRFGRDISRPSRRSARTIAQPPPALILNQTINLSESKAPRRKSSRNVHASKAQSSPPRKPAAKKTRPAKIASPPPPPPENLAWRYLAAGTSQAALRHFSEESGRTPMEGLPRIGMGISAALRGEIKWSIQSFRRAFRDDPQGAASIPVVHGLRKRLQRIADYFKDEADESTDSQFMLAAIGHYLNDEEQARQALDRAISLGDDSMAAKNLMKILTGQIASGPTEASPSPSEETL